MYKYNTQQIVTSFYLCMIGVHGVRIMFSYFLFLVKGFYVISYS